MLPFQVCEDCSDSDGCIARGFCKVTRQIERREEGKQYDCWPNGTAHLPWTPDK